MNASAPSGLRRDDGFGGRGDDFYELLMRAHEGLDEARSAALNARCLLLLANQVGDIEVIRQALDAARASLAPPAQ
ncbi:MAG: DUF2783 domain-containing protein [Nevskia sp.]|nr:DUF2783 domain-containing protein [Nevskia sp.]